jgi:gluconolactonase
MTPSRRAVLAGMGALLAAPSWAARGPAVDIVAEGLAFPEGLVALPDGSLLFVEIAAGTLRRLKPGAGPPETVAHLGGGPNGTTIGADGAAYVANNGGLSFARVNGRLTPTGIPAAYRGGAIQRVDLATGAVKTLYEAVDGVPLKAPDDIVCDAWGDLWFTDIGKSHPRYRDHGGIYWCKADGSAIRAAAFPVQNPNGLAFAPDGRTLYVALSDRREIAAFTVADRGRLADGPPRIIAALDGVRLFDNIAVTADGLITIACVLTGELVTIDPRGRIVDVVALPDPAPTALAFGGADRRDLYVTLSGTGRIARLRWPRAGLPPLPRS